ncbi:MAG: YncE family protein [bacterium]
MVVCRRWDNPYDPASNRPPNPPQPVFPESAAINVDTGVVLRWRCSDPNIFDTLRYYIYLSRSTPPSLWDSAVSDTFYHPLNLQVLSTYYWQIIAKDRFDKTASGPIWHFSTAKANRFPNVPSNPAPDSGAIGQFVRLTLSWSGGDPDTADTVVYDIYLGTSSPPPISVQGHNQTRYTTPRLKYDSTYYWRVVARDQRGAITTGPIWQFTTFPAVRVLVPNDTTRWRTGSQQTILWTGGPITAGQNSLIKNGIINLLNSKPLNRHNLVAEVDSTVIFYSTNGGTTWLRHGRATTTNRYDWTVPTPPTTNARVQVRMYLLGDTALGNSPRYEIYDTRKPAPIVVTAPDSSSEWTIGSTHEILWTGGTLAGMDSAVIYYSTNNGVSWQRQGKTTRPGCFVWTVPPPVTNQAKIRVRAFCVDSSTTGISATFKVIEGLPPITVISPNAQTRWREGAVEIITWTGGPTGLVADSITIYYSTDDGVNWMRHGRASTSGSYEWNVPGPATIYARVQVRAYAGVDSVAGTSERYVIYDSLAPSPITVTSPAAGIRWLVGTTHEITWSGGTLTGMDSTVIFYSTDDGLSWQRQGRATQLGRFTWTVPPPPTNNAVVSVRAWCGEHLTEGRSGTFIVGQSGGTPDTVIATVVVGSKPRALLWDSIHDKIFVANYNDSSVSVIDGATNQVITTVRVGGFPFNLCLNSLNGKVYAANQVSGTISVIDGATNQVITTVGVGSYPQAMCFNSNDNRLYVTNYRGATVTVIDGVSDEVLTTVPVDTNPIALVYNLMYNKIYCANFANNTVTVIDGATNQVITTVNVDYQPCALVVDGRNNVAVVNRMFGKVSVINGANQSVIATVNVGSEPYAIGYNASDNRLYVANSASNNISVINVNNYTVQTNINAGDHPRNLIWAGWVNKVYVTNYDSRNVTLIDGATNTVQKTITVGDNPIAVCSNSWDNKVYIANYNSNTVSIIGSTADFVRRR